MIALHIYQIKTKGQQLQGKIVSSLFHTFWHFSTHFRTFSEFLRVFPPGVFFELRGFTTVFVQRDEKRIKENKKKKAKPFRTILHVSCCTFVLLRIYYAMNQSFERSMPAKSMEMALVQGARDSRPHCDSKFTMCVVSLLHVVFSVPLGSFEALFRI